jgi:hypothetical protein
MSNSILVNFETEMQKEREHSESRLVETEATARAHSESCLAEMEAAFTKCCNSLEMKFMSALEETKKKTETL